MNKTAIGWTDYSTNPLRATNRETGKAGHFCEKVSPGCAKCYASEWNEKRYGTGLAFLPANRERVDCWLNERELAEWQKKKYTGAKVFVEDMSDLFAEWVPDAWLDRIFAAMALAPAVTFQLLTKRPERMQAYLTAEWRRTTINMAGIRLAGIGADKSEKTQAFAKSLVSAIRFEADRYEGSREEYIDDAMFGGRWPLPNVWLGVSVENQHWADERIEQLLRTPAAVHFVSCEPLLGPISFTRIDAMQGPYNDWLRGEVREINMGEEGVYARFKGLDWVIVGGESGPKRRPMELAWLESVVAQCQAAGTPVWVKQDVALRPGQQGRISDATWQVKEWPA